LYFITICCQDRVCRFGEIVGAGFTPAQIDHHPIGSPTDQPQIGQPQSEQPFLDQPRIGQPQGIAPTNQPQLEQPFLDQPRIGQPQGIAPTGAEMVLNEFGMVAYNEWVKLSERFPNFVLDVFQIMPNHMHGIIALNVGAPLAGAQYNTAPNPTQNDTQIGQPYLDQPGIGQPQGIAPTNQPQLGQPQSGHTGIGQPQGIAPTNQPQLRQPQLGHSGIGQPYLDQLRIGQPQGIAPTNQPQLGQPQLGHTGIGQPQGLPLPKMDDYGAGVNPAPTKTATIGDIVGAYKSLVTKGCIEIWKSKWAGVNPEPTMGKLWQRNYYEHIIRDEASYLTISNYIVNNPANWKEDKFFC